MLQLVFIVLFSLALIENGQDAFSQAAQAAQAAQAEQAAEMRRYEAQRIIYNAWQGKSYFPKDGLGKGDTQGAYSRARRVSYSLTGLGEPVLKNMALPEGEAIVRLTLSSSSYGHYAFRAVAVGEARILYITLSYSAEIGPVEVHAEQQVALTPESFAQIQELAEAVKGFGPRSDGWIVFDGAYWISESVSAQGYSVNFYHSPGQGPWQELAQMMFGFVDEDHRTGLIERFIPPTAEELRRWEEAERQRQAEICAMGYSVFVNPGYCEE